MSLFSKLNNFDVQTVQQFSYLVLVRRYNNPLTVRINKPIDFDAHNRVFVCFGDFILLCVDSFNDEDMCLF